MNRIPKFAPDGRDVVLGWRDNGNAHGYELPCRDAADEARCFLLERRRHLSQGFDAPIEDTIRDDPHLGEDLVRAVRFARGTLDGTPATLLFTATRELDVEVGIPGPCFTSFDVYRLTQSALHNKILQSQKALFKWFGLAPPASYAGAENRRWLPEGLSPLADLFD